MLDKYLVAGGNGWTNKRTTWSEKEGSDLNMWEKQNEIQQGWIVGRWSETLKKAKRAERRSKQKCSRQAKILTLKKDEREETERGDGAGWRKRDRLEMQREMDGTWEPTREKKRKDGGMQQRRGNHRGERGDL